MVWPRRAKRRSDFAVIPEIIVSVGEDHSATRRLLGFYGSTPAYRPVLEIHGWGDLQPELNALSKQGRWEEMGKLIDDDVLHTIAACGTPAEVAAHIRDRVDGISDQICLYQPGPVLAGERWPRSLTHCVADRISWYRGGPREVYGWR